MIETRILETKYTPREALVLLLHTDPNLDIEDIEDVYYPYVRMRFELTVGTGKFVKQLVKYVDCIIDRVLGTSYDTVYDKDSDGKPIYRDVEIDDEDCLDPVLSEEQYRAKGHDFALKQYIGRAKLMFTPKFAIVEEEQFYKHFYVVTCRDKEGRIYFIMVDAVDGGISILDHEAHIDELAKIGDYNQLQMLAGETDYEDEDLDEEDYDDEEGDDKE